MSERAGVGGDGEFAAGDGGERNLFWAAALTALADCGATLWRWNVATEKLDTLAGVEHSGDLADLASTLRAASRGAGRRFQRTLASHPAADHAALLCSATPEADADGNCVALVGLTVPLFESLDVGRDLPEPADAGDLTDLLDGLNSSHREALSALGEAEDERQRAENRFRAIAEGLATATLRTDGDGRLVEPAPRWVQFTGQSWPQAQGRGWLACVHPGDREALQLLWDDANREAAPFSTELRLRRTGRAGDASRCLVRAAPVLAGAGNVEEWIISVQDVSGSYAQLTRLQDETQRLHSQLQALLENRPKPGGMA